MAIQLQVRRGTTAQNNAFTGAAGELSVNTDTSGIRVHDGVVAGGVELARSNQIDSLLVKSVAGGVDVTLSANEASNSNHEYTGILTGNINVIIPATSHNFTAENLTTGAFTLTVKTAAGTGISIQQGKALQLYCNGTNVEDSNSAKAALIGSNNQTFSVSSAAAAEHAVRLDQSYIAQDFRLTLTSATPVTITDVAAATTIYMTPYKGNRIGLWNGAAWRNQSSVEISLALGTLTTDLPYDVFCYNNAGTATLEFLAWTSIATRATALAYQDGILVKSGDATRRYIGTFYTTATTTTEDSLANRYLWNYYNRVARPMKATDATASWTYASATLRQARASTANQLNYIQGVSEDAITAHVTMNGDTTTAGQAMTSGIGIDSTSVDSALTNTGNQIFTAVTTQGFTSDYVGNIAAGRHFLAWLESSNASNGTFRGSVKSGIFGSLMA